MGCFHSRHVFEVNNEIEGQDKATMEVLEELGLSASDINVLYTAFWDIDADGSGAIQPIELFHYFEVESTPFEMAVFTLFDEDESGIINFMEFVCSLWNILTLDELNMGGLAFNIVDRTGMKIIGYKAVERIFEVMHKKKVEKDAALHDMMLEVKKDLRREINIQEFTEWCHHHPSVLSPLMMLQMHLRDQIIGPRFWQKMTKLRKEHPEQGLWDYLPKLQSRIIEQNEKFKAKGQLEEAERRRKSRRGKGTSGDHRDNVTRKQSLIMSYFAISRNSVLRSVSFSRKKRNKEAMADHEAQEKVEKKAEYDALVNPKARKPRQRRSFHGKKPDLNREKAEASSKNKSKAKGRHKYNSVGSDTIEEEEDEHDVNKRSSSKKNKKPPPAASSSGSGAGSGRNGSTPAGPASRKDKHRDSWDYDANMPDAAYRSTSSKDTSPKPPSGKKRGERSADQ
mmetsp:Transcript_4703/g.7681  ORF Transcript_4703/g.7681 Transcript_4703/m.7681 type:complete len:453 (+) Transcript_4703:91-1449(+)